MIEGSALGYQGNLLGLASASQGEIMSTKNSKTDGPHSNQSETEALIWYGFKETSLNKPAL